MKKYIDAEKLIAEIQRRKKQDITMRERSILIDIETAIASLQQEQPMPNSTQLIELWHQDKEMLKEKDFRNDPWRLAYNAFMCGFGRGLAVNKLAQPEVDLSKEIARFALNGGTGDNTPTIGEIARHFYELGIKARKEE